jgi:rare lipoprotein A
MTRAGVAVAVLGMLGLGTGCATRAVKPPPPEPATVTRPPKPAPKKPAPSPEQPARGYLGEGLASYYGPGLHGRPTASGERFNMHAMTAAHRTLAFGTCVRVVNMENGRSVDVRVNDRGPFKEGRIIDVSLAAAKKLELVDKGLARVRLYRCEAPVSSIPAPFQAAPG